MSNFENVTSPPFGVVNTEVFTRLKQTVEGSFAPASLPRLAETLVFPEGELNCRIEGRLLTRADGSQQRGVRCIITGWVTLQCQTTLKPLLHPLNIDRTLVLFDAESAMPALEDEPDDEDYVVAGQQLDLSSLVEDEVILDLPMFPHCADSDAQASPEKSNTGREVGSPFAMLATLKKPNS